MFRTITEEPDMRLGKKAGESALHGKAHHHPLGTDNEMLGAKSTFS